MVFQKQELSVHELLTIGDLARGNTVSMPVGTYVRDLHVCTAYEITCVPWFLSLILSV